MPPRRLPRDGGGDGAACARSSGLAPRPPPRPAGSGSGRPRRPSGAGPVGRLEHRRLEHGHRGPYGTAPAAAPRLLFGPGARPRPASSVRTSMRTDSAGIPKASASAATASRGGLLDGVAVATDLVGVVDLDGPAVAVAQRPAAVRGSGPACPPWARAPRASAAVSRHRRRRSHGGRLLPAGTPSGGGGGAAWARGRSYGCPCGSARARHSRLLPERAPRQPRQARELRRERWPYGSHDDASAQARHPQPHPKQRGQRRSHRRQQAQPVRRPQRRPPRQRQQAHPPERSPYGLHDDASAQARHPQPHPKQRGQRRSHRRQQAQPVRRPRQRGSGSRRTRRSGGLTGRTATRPPRRGTLSLIRGGGNSTVRDGLGGGHTRPRQARELRRERSPYGSHGDASAQARHPQPHPRRRGQRQPACTAGVPPSTERHPGAAASAAAGAPAGAVALRVARRRVRPGAAPSASSGATGAAAVTSAAAGSAGVPPSTTTSAAAVPAGAPAGAVALRVARRRLAGAAASSAAASGEVCSAGAPAGAGALRVARRRVRGGGVVSGRVRAGRTGECAGGGRAEARSALGRANPPPWKNR